MLVLIIVLVAQRSMMCVHTAGSPLLPLPFRLPVGPWEGTQLSCYRSWAQDPQRRPCFEEFIAKRALPGNFLFWSHRNRKEVYKGWGWKVVHPQGLWNWRKPWTIQELEDECEVWRIPPETADRGIPMTRGLNQGFNVIVHQFQALAEFHSVQKIVMNPLPRSQCTCYLLTFYSGVSWLLYIRA